MTFYSKVLLVLLADFVTEIHDAHALVNFSDSLLQYIRAKRK